MKQEIAKIWIEALRSGDYTQGRRHLKRAGRHCCLGVLCELAVQAKVIDGLDRGGILPAEVREWAGMYQSDGTPRDFTYHTDDAGKTHYKNGFGAVGADHLASWNDKGATFAEIADAIEQNVERL